MAEPTLEELLAQIEPEPEVPTERGRSFLQGLTFGTADEIEAYIKSIGSDREY